MARQIFFFAIITWACWSSAADWFVATNGTASGKGTVRQPWDITSALGGRHKIAPGDTLWIARGTYKYPPEVGSMGFPVTLKGTKQAPIHVRATPGQRATIDGGLSFKEPVNYVWVWDLEVMVSEPRPAKALPPDPTYKNVNRPWGGINIYAGNGCKFINLVIHDNAQGASWWSGSQNSEMHGCILYDNGWLGTDRGHGHAIYTQNQDGTKTISDCIMMGGFGYSMHAYGSARAYVDHYIVERNIADNAGRFLIGGGRPSQDIQVYSNLLYNVSMQVGYSARTNIDCIVRGNVIVNGDLEVLRFERAKVENNLLVNKNEPAPGAARVIIYPNKYESSRANLVVLNWNKDPVVQVDASCFLKRGEKFRLMNPLDFFGKAVMEGRCQDGKITLRMAGEFGAWVILKEVR